MKKVLAIILCIGMCLALAACGGGGSADDEDASSVLEAPKGKLEISVVTAERATDIQGRDSVLVIYKVVNNIENRVTSYREGLNVTVKQGDEMLFVLTTDDPRYDSSSYEKKLAYGEEVEVAVCYGLANETDDITFTLTPRTGEDKSDVVIKKTIAEIDQAKADASK